MTSLPVHSFYITTGNRYLSWMTSLHQIRKIYTKKHICTVVAATTTTTTRRIMNKLLIPSGHLFSLTCIHLLQKWSCKGQRARCLTHKNQDYNHADVSRICNKQVRTHCNQWNFKEHEPDMIYNKYTINTVFALFYKSTHLETPVISSDFL